MSRPKHKKGRRQISEVAAALGYQVSITRRGHLRCKHASGQITHISSKMKSGHKVLENTLAVLRRGARGGESG